MQYIFMKECLTLAKGGKLFQTSWNSEIQDYETKEVTDQALRLLFEICELEQGVTLKDIFLLLNTELDIFNAVLGNWCKELVTEGLTQPQRLYTGQYDPDAIEYLELYWDFWYNASIKDGPCFRGYERPDLHGKGFELKEDLLHSWKNDDGTPAVEWPKGKRIPWSLSFQKTNDLINIPVKLDGTVSVYNDNLDDKNWHEELMKFEGAGYTLGNILYGIVWELSFFGGPEDRNEKGDELKEISKELKERKNENPT